MIEALIDEIRNLPEDYNAEALAGQLFDAGLDTRRLYVRMLHANQRPFSRDVAKAEKIEVKTGDEALQLTVTRTGIYDLLPEGIFFQPPEHAKRKQSAAEMAEEYRASQKQEKELRSFFAPLEQELFHHRYKSYAADAALLHRLSGGLLNDYLLQFWQLHPALPAGAAIRLILLLPFVHQIAGDAALMASALQAVIREPVKCFGYYQWDQTATADSNVLGRMMLGTDATSNVRYREDDFVFDFNITFGDERKIQDYLQGGGHYHLLQTFYNYFAPANTEQKTTLLVQNKAVEWRLGQPAQHLGISSTI